MLLHATLIRRAWPAYRRAPRRTSLAYLNERERSEFFHNRGPRLRK
jgi:hypothetical protein